MLFSYNWLQSFFNKNLPKPEKLGQLLTMHNFEVEGIEKRGKDWILDIDVLSNRGHDCLSHIGICREISAITGLKINPVKSPHFGRGLPSKTEQKSVSKIYSDGDY